MGETLNYREWLHDIKMINMDRSLWLDTHFTEYVRAWVDHIPEYLEYVIDRKVSAGLRELLSDVLRPVIAEEVESRLAAMHENRPEPGTVIFVDGDIKADVRWTDNQYSPVCKSCGGTGMVNMPYPKQPAVICPTCNGSGGC